MPPEQKPKTPQPLKSAAAQQGTSFPVPQSPERRTSGKPSDTPQPFRNRTPLPDSSAKGDTAVPAPMQPAGSSGPAKPAPATLIDDAIVRTIDDHHVTVPISIEELRKKGLLE